MKSANNLFVGTYFATCVAQIWQLRATYSLNLGGTAIFCNFVT